MDGRLSIRFERARGASAAGAAGTSEPAFLEAVAALLGDPRLLWVTGQAGAGAGASRTRGEAAVSWSPSIAAGDVSALGGGWALACGAAGPVGTLADGPGYRFGSGVADAPFTLAALVRPAVNDAAMDALSKRDATTGAIAQEWSLGLDASGQAHLHLVEQSATAGSPRLGRRATAPFGTGWGLLVGTADGGGAAEGLRVYQNGVRVDGANEGAGAYGAMAPTAAAVRIGARGGDGGTTHRWNGAIALAAVTGRALTADEVWRLTALVSGYFDLSL
jgi:hypothetical protein